MLRLVVLPQEVVADESNNNFYDFRESLNRVQIVIGFCRYQPKKKEVEDD